MNSTNHLLIDEDCAYLTLFPIEIARIQKPLKKGNEGFGVAPNQNHNRS